MFQDDFASVNPLYIQAFIRPFLVLEDRSSWQLINRINRALVKHFLEALREQSSLAFVLAVRRGLMLAEAAPPRPQVTCIFPLLSPTRNKAAGSIPHTSGISGGPEVYWGLSQPDKADGNS